MISETLFDQILVIIVVSAPVLNVYSIAGMGIGTLLLIILEIIIFLFRIRSRGKPSLFLSRNVKIILIPLASMSLFTFVGILFNENILISNIIGRIGYIFIYSLVLIECQNLEVIDIAKKTLRIWCLIITMGLIFQIVSHYIFGHQLSLFIPGLETSTEDISRRYIIDRNVFRPNSILNESSHVAYYLSVGLLVELFFDNHNDRTKWVVLCCIGLVFSTSATAFAFLALIWIVYFLYDKKLAPRRIFVYIIYLSLFVIVIGRVGFFDKIIYSIERFSTDRGRIFGFLDYYNQMTETEKILGIGMGNVRLRFETYYRYWNANMSGFGKFLVEGGIINAIIYVASYCRLYAINFFPQKVIVLFFFVLNIIEGSMFGVYFDFVLIWMVLSYDNGNTSRI